MSDPAAGPEIELRAVVKEYDHGAIRALTGVDLRVERREFVAITGPSSCGTSSLLHLLAALKWPTSGDIAVRGRDLRYRRDLDAYRRSEIGLVFQLHNLLPPDPGPAEPHDRARDARSHGVGVGRPHRRDARWPRRRGATPPGRGRPVTDARSARRPVPRSGFVGTFVPVGVRRRPPRWKDDRRG
jgi:hypothetical protein